MIDEIYRARAKELFAELDKEMCRLGHASGDWCNPGLSEDEISENERKLGVVFPDEYKACYSIFNGAFDNDHLDVLHAGEIYTGFYLSPLGAWGDDQENMRLVKEFYYDRGTSELQEMWVKMPLTVIGPAKPMLHHRKWLPITMPGGWYSWYADFAPEHGGSAGQIVLVTSDYQSAHVEVVAHDFFEFMEILISSAKAEPA